MASQLVGIGMNVRHFEVGPGRYGEGGRGWRFGRVIATKWIADLGSAEPGGLMAGVVRFCDDGEAAMLPLFRLERCEPLFCSTGCECRVCQACQQVCG